MAMACIGPRWTNEFMGPNYTEPIDRGSNIIVVSSIVLLV
jgi:hypothetical protein